MDDAELFWDEPLRDLLWEVPPSAGGSSASARRGGSALRRLSLNCRSPEGRKPVRLPSEMSDRELAFLCGLLRRRRPEKVVEVGVAMGATSAVILKTLALLGGVARLHSVDLSAMCYRVPDRETGYIVAEKAPEFLGNWNLRTGRVVDAFMPEIGDGVDFCILDTVHRLPGELFDFLAVLPYLKDGAVVVLHDTQLHTMKPEYPSYATCVLLSVVAAEKIIVRDEKRREGVANIAAFVVTPETRKYVSNVFSALMLPWGYMPDDRVLDDILVGMARNYPPSYVDYFKRALNLNSLMNGGARKCETDSSGERLLIA